MSESINLTVREMKKILMLRGIRGISRLRKADLESLMNKYFPKNEEINVNARFSIDSINDYSTITVRCGIEEENMPLIGMKISEALQIIKKVIKIPNTKTFLINGSNVGDNYILQTNDKLEIVKNAYVKGLQISTNV